MVAVPGLAGTAKEASVCRRASIKQNLVEMHSPLLAKLRALHIYICTSTVTQLFAKSIVKRVSQSPQGVIEYLMLATSQNFYFACFAKTFGKIGTVVGRKEVQCISEPP